MDRGGRFYRQKNFPRSFNLPYLPLRVTSKIASAVVRRSSDVSGPLSRQLVTTNI